MMGTGNYKVQDIATRRIYVSRDVVFEEGRPHRTLASVGEQQVPIPLFDEDIVPSLTNHDPDTTTVVNDADPDQIAVDQGVSPAIPVEPRRSTRASQPLKAGIHSAEYKMREVTGKDQGQDWATDGKRSKTSLAMTIDYSEDPDHKNIIACLTDTKASHQIPRSYKHAMATDPERWMIPMQVEMDTLKAKHTWDLVKAPPEANVMDSMWVFDIKWDGEGKRIKDKARLVGKGYTQQLGVDYNETWAGVTRLESVWMTAAIAAKLDLTLWQIDFVGAYLNSLTKEDIYMKQPEGFVENGYEDYVCKLIHTIYGTMQGGHDWYETLGETYDNLGYTTSRADPCVRFKKENGNYTITDTYTDDVFGASNDDEEAKRRKDEMGKVWEIKDVGENEYFLGMQVEQDLKSGTI